MKAVCLVLGTGLVLFFAASLRAQDHVEVFGGYSYFRASVTETGTILCPGPTCPPKTVSTNPSLNGWEAGLEYKPFKEIGLVADFGGNYGSLPSSSGGGSMHTNTYLFGPRVSVPARVSPFVHVLAGVEHQSTDTSASGVNFFPGHSSNAFALALGGGIDLEAFPLVRVRLIQLDYVGSNSGLSFHNQARISAGFVFHF